MSSNFYAKCDSRLIENFAKAIETWRNFECGGNWSILEFEDNERHAFVFTEGSIRGLAAYVHPESTDTIVVRLNILASSADWQLAYSLLRTLHASGAQLTEDSDSLIDVQNLTSGDAIARAKSEFADGCDTLHWLVTEKELKGFNLGVDGFALPLTPEDLAGANSPDAIEALKNRLIETANRYARADRHPMYMLDKNNNIEAVAWLFDARIIPEAQAIILTRRFYGNVVKRAVLHFGDALAELAERAEQLPMTPPKYYLPKLDFTKAEDEQLYKRLVAKAFKTA